MGIFIKVPLGLSPIFHTVRYFTVWNEENHLKINFSQAQSHD